MSGHVLIGGGTGFIGRALTNYLRGNGYGVTVISRMPGPMRLSWHDVLQNGIPKDTTAVINLAGQNVLDVRQRWTEGFKQNVWNSRINTTKQLNEAIMKSPQKPDVFIVISGVSIYKPEIDKEYDENSNTKGYDFISRLAEGIEEVATLPYPGCRQVIIRSGVVLGREGGMVKELFLPFYLGLGGPVGSGKQYLPWIHVTDLVRLFTFCVENKNVKGILNGVAPQIITNKQFSNSFARALWRPALIPVPEMVFNILFSEERARMITKGQRVVPKRVQEYGFEYLYPNIQSACKEFARLRLKMP